ncbi:diguanylate cyclase [Neptunicella sp.]|uniref:sensor domain-containing diguanylate cyclase n=1 Tax=Neptunicella sp. TaxID=2125986 RepID=UPI003F69191D
MLLNFLRPNHLSQKMLRVVFSIYLGVTCLITGTQFLTEYLKTQHSISSELNQLQATVRDPIAASLWQYNQTQLDVLVDGLVKMPIIQGVDVFDQDGNSIVTNRSYAPTDRPLSVFSVKSELSWTLMGKKVLLGSLVLYSSSQVIFDRVLFGFLLIALTAIIKLSLLFWLFVWAFDRYLAQPLKTLMSQVEEVQLNHNASQRIHLPDIENNELKQLQEHMNKMLGAIEKDKQRLLEDEQEKRNWLEDAVTERTAELQVLNDKLKNLATRDSLTGTLNRGSFFETAEHMRKLAQRQQSSASFVLMDLDHFKRINDTYGHFIGDQVLIHFTKTTQSFLRKSDLLGRLGGEEFALFLSDTGVDDAFLLAERVRKAITDSTLQIDGKTVTYTVSFGVVCAEPTDQSISDLFKRADLKLYGAKEHGRDRVER